MSTAPSKRFWFRPTAASHASSATAVRAGRSDLRALATPPEMVYEAGVVVGHEFSGTVVDAGREVMIETGSRGNQVLTCSRGLAGAAHEVRVPTSPR